MPFPAINMSGISTSRSWNWSEFCGHGESIQSWEGKDFGHCFEQVAMLAPAHALLAIVSVYHFGKRRTSLRGNSLYVSWTWFLVLRFLSVLALLACPVFQVIFSVTLEHLLPSIADGVVVGTAFFAWFLHAFYIWNLRYLHSNSLRGPLSAVVVFLVVVASCAIHVHTVILRHISLSPHRNVTEEYCSYVNAGLCLIYFISIIPNGRRIYHTNITFQINETSDESEPLTWDRIQTYSSTSSSQTGDNITAERGVGCFSWLTFQWVQRLMSRGAKLKISNVDDLYLLPDRLNTCQLDAMFEEVIQNFLQLPKKKNSNVDVLVQSLQNCADVPEVSAITHSSQSSLPVNYERFESYQSHLIDSSENEITETGSYSPQDDRYREEKTSRKNMSLFKALASAFGFEYFFLGILKLLADCFGFAGPILLNYLVTLVENKSNNYYQGYLFAGGLFLSTLLGTLCSTQFDYNVQVVAYKIRCALVTTVYRKSLTVNGVAQAKFTSGEIVNFMSTDTDRILNFCPSFHAFWSLPFQVGVTLYLLYQQVGLAFLAGVAFAILLIPINRCIAVKIGELSKEMMKYKDERVKLMNEVLYGIRVVKFYSWEQHFTSRINQMRTGELRCLKGRKYLDALCVYFWATTPVLISILTFSTYVLIGNKLTAAKVFTSLSLFLMLIGPLNAFPWVINGLVEAWVSLKRVEGFVCLENSDLQSYYSSEDDSDENPVIEIKSASFTWMSQDRGPVRTDQTPYSSLEDQSFEEENRSQDSSTSIHQTPSQDLECINLTVRQGQFFGIVGKVGSGKSSILSAIIGEMNKKEGEIFVADLESGFAFVAQEPWIQHATIRDNILFGQPFNGQRYDLVLHACALLDDLQIMPSGDMTEIGENGITLSGGQRARVALARAVYQDKSIYLLDDPLSAVDAHVAQHIYTYCIMGLLAEKTRILCTHHVKFLTRADWVIVMEDGRIVQSGLPGNVLPNVQLSDERRHDHKKMDETKEQDPDEEEKEDALVQEEERQKGAVKATVLKSYWYAVGACLSPLVLITLFFMQASRNISDWWLSYWVSHSEDKTTGNKDLTSLLAFWLRKEIPFSNLTSAEDNLRFYLGIYGGLAGANSVFTFMRAFLFAYGGICAATVIHKRLLSAILKAPVTFFDSTPIGRIVNRFSSDLYTVDDSLPFILNIFLAQLYGIFGTLVITCYGLPWFAICLVPLGAVYYKIQHYYRHTSRELKRLSSVTLSPIYAHFSETITGLATIRAMKQTKRFCEENQLRLDINQRAQYATQLSARWLDFRLRMLGVAMVTCSSLIAVIQHQLTTIDAGLVGLAISYSLSVTNLLGGVVMFFTETEKEFVSVERCQHYITETASEKWDGALFAPTLWPTEGVIEFDDVCLQYRETSTYALDGVSFKICPGEKIGIVGRTGAGKSSLFLALFRLVEVSRGRIIVDDVDISHLDLTDIRSRFAIIPQDPFLFSGSVRLNLDPNNSYSDTDLWLALERCHLRACVDRMGGLEAVVAQKGREFSVGQRQLMCLARAMLTKAKILCIDEATASVDMETDGLIQNTIRHEFRDSTVLTIAHRVNTVVDSHRVLVMKDGGVAEFAPPGDLLQDSSSLFYHLVYGNN